MPWTNVWRRRRAIRVVTDCARIICDRFESPFQDTPLLASRSGLGPGRFGPTDCANFACYSGCSGSSTFAGRLLKQRLVDSQRRESLMLAELAVLLPDGYRGEVKSGQKACFIAFRLCLGSLTVLPVVRVSTNFFDTTGCDGRSCSQH